MSPVSQIYLGVPGFVIFWLLFVVVLVLFIQRAYKLWCFVRLGGPDSRVDKLSRRILTTLSYVFLQKCSLRRVTLSDRAGLGHFLIFWGFMLSLISYLIYIFIGDGLGFSETIRESTFSNLYSYILDIAALMVLVAIIWAAFRRYVLRPARLEVSAEAAIILALISVLMLSHFSIEGIAINISSEHSASWTPLRQLSANLFAEADISLQKVLYTSVWWLHYIVIIGFLVFIPYSKHLHLMASPFNIMFRNLKTRGALSTIDLENTESFGVDRVEKFTWKQLLDGLACTHCGRCQAACPAWNSGKPLSPKEVVLHIKDYLFETGPSLIAAKKAAVSSQSNPEESNTPVQDSSSHPDMVSDIITEEVIWECTTCRACQEECPVLIEHIQKLVDMRRHLVLERAQVPETALNALKSIESRGHPWRGTTVTRTDWTKGLDIKTLAEDKNIDVLYWVGCTAALEDRNIKVAVAMGKILKQAGINFGILGDEETCCGEPVRRLGNEYLFQMLVMKNIETLKGYGVKKILTSCPHCFNTIKNEYPQFGGEFEVIHHSQFLSKLISQGKFNIGSLTPNIATYHDSCYLGRYNDVYTQPRQILKSMPGLKLVEMGRRLQKGFCCGGGGGRLWQEETIGERINRLRTQEAMDTGANIIATACPYCLQMFEDGLKAKNADETIKAMDLAELLVAATARKE